MDAESLLGDSGVDGELDRYVVTALAIACRCWLALPSARCEAIWTMNGRNLELLSLPPPLQSVLKEAPVANLASI
jgi:hypothetical protein